MEWKFCGSSQVMLIKEHRFGWIIKSNFFKNLFHAQFRGKDVDWGVSFYYSKAFLMKLQFHYVDVFIQISTSSEIVCYYCFHYFHSFYSHCFSLELDFFSFFINQEGSLLSTIKVYESENITLFVVRGLC